MVVADDRYQAEDAAASVGVDYEPLPVITTIEESLADGAPRLFEDWDDNRLLHFPHASDAVAAAFERYPSVRLTVESQRQSGNPMETRGVVAEYRGGRLTVWSSTQVPHMLRSTLALVLGLSESQIRVVTPDVGGGFGAKLHQYSEEVVVAWLAMRLERPVRWIEDRAEHMVTAVHAREQVMEMQAAYDTDGTIKALRCDLVTDIGSGEIFAPPAATSLTSAGVLTGPYKIELRDVNITCAVTNKTPSGAYRGFGQGESVFAMERVIERVAAAAGVDANAVRRSMLVKAEDLPYTTAAGGILDSGSHLEAFDRTVELTEQLAAKVRAECADDPSVRVGVGYSSYVEATAPTHFGTSGIWTAYDSAAIQITPDGGARVAVGAAAIGQGTETMVATLAADALSLPIEKVSVSLGDTDQTPYGLGAWGSRGAVVSAGAVVKAARVIREKASRIAAALLEASPDDITLTDGAYHVEGSPEPGVTLAAVANAAWGSTMRLPYGEEPGLSAVVTFDPPGVTHFPDSHGKMNAAATWSNASHGTVVKVNLATGVPEIAEYVVVHDCGTLINPTSVAGQIQGGVAQGIAGALYEQLHYSESGQPESASFMQYLIPTAIEIPDVTIDHFETPAPGIPLGVKGAGESGTIGCAAAVASAIDDALSEFGAAVTSLPVTPSMIREIVREQVPEPWDLEIALPRAGTARRHEARTVQAAATGSSRVGVRGPRRVRRRCQLLAGGQSLVPTMNFSLAQPAVVVDLSLVEGLDRIAVDDGAVRIGAMVRQRSAETDAVVRDQAPMIPRALRFVGHVQNRNRGTIGGSVAHADPAAELPAVALALGAQLRLVSSRGERTVEATDFVHGPFMTAIETGEVLVEVRIPRRPEARVAVHEIARRHGDYAVAGVAASLELDADERTIRSASLAAFGVTSNPVRLSQVESLLAGSVLDSDVIRSASREAARSIDRVTEDQLATAEYRRDALGVLTARALVDVAQQVSSPNGQRGDRRAGGPGRRTRLRSTSTPTTSRPRTSPPRGHASTTPVFPRTQPAS